MAKKDLARLQANWPADKVERRPLADLIPYARNARTHSDDQVAQLAASMKEWGFTVPILIDETGEIIAGHGRVLAARKLGLESVPTMTAVGWSEAKKRAYVLADNKLAMNAGWDDDTLKLELHDLEDAGFDLGLVGFSIGELGDLLGTGQGEDPPPEHDEGIEYEEHFAIIVTCDSESDQTEKYDALMALGYTCKVLVN